jgi:hypothetical protein
MLSAERLERIFGCPCGWRGRPGQCAAFRPNPYDLSPGDRDPARGRLAPPSSRGRGHRVRVAAGLAACGGGPADLVAAPRPKGSRPSGRGRPPTRSRRAARDPARLCHVPHVALRNASMNSRFPRLNSAVARTAWRAEGAPLKTLEIFITGSAQGAPAVPSGVRCPSSPTWHTTPRGVWPHRGPKRAVSCGVQACPTPADG